MSVHLVGGGRDLGVAGVVYEPFLAEAAGRASRTGRSVPRVAVVVVGEPDDHDAAVDWFRQALRACGAVEVSGVCAGEDAAELTGSDGGTPAAGWWRGLDGLLVGGGLTPAYHRLLRPHAGDIASAVAGGLPYAGFSAGAAVAARTALLGGWRLGETAVTAEDNAEDLDQLVLAPGLGLLDLVVDVHATQWGTLSRLVAAVGAGGAADRGVAIDENTVLILPATPDTDPAGRPVPVRGAGQAWFADRIADGVRVVRRPADLT